MESKKIKKMEEDIIYAQSKLDKIMIMGSNDII